MGIPLLCLLPVSVHSIASRHHSRYRPRQGSTIRLVVQFSLAYTFILLGSFSFVDPSFYIRFPSRFNSFLLVIPPSLLFPLRVQRPLFSHDQ